MFSYSSSLKNVKFSTQFNTQNVKDMSYMFDNCSSLRQLNLSYFNTQNVINMRYMFFKCSKLKDLDLSNFNTDKVIDVSGMFDGCSLELKKKIRKLNKKIYIQYFE